MISFQKYRFYFISSREVKTGWPTVLEFLEFLELFWIFFGTGNVLEKSHFFRLVLELFLNSEFLTSDFLGGTGIAIDQTFPVAPCLDLPFVRKYYFSFAQLFVLEKCENVLELFWNFFKNSVGHPVSFYFKINAPLN